MASFSWYDVKVIVTVKEKIYFLQARILWSSKTRL
jgi:hypothetical protein